MLLFLKNWECKQEKSLLSISIQLRLNIKMNRAKYFVCNLTSKTDSRLWRSRLKKTKNKSLSLKLSQHLLDQSKWIDKSLSKPLIWNLSNWLKSYKQVALALCSFMVCFSAFTTRVKTRFICHTFLGDTV